MKSNEARIASWCCKVIEPWLEQKYKNVGFLGHLEHDLVLLLKGFDTDPKVWALTQWELHHQRDLVQQLLGGIKDQLPEDDISSIMAGFDKEVQRGLQMTPEQIFEELRQTKINK